MMYSIVSKDRKYILDLRGHRWYLMYGLKDKIPVWEYVNKFVAEDEMEVYEALSYIRQAAVGSIRNNKKWIQKYKDVVEKGFVMKEVEVKVSFREPLIK